MKRWCSRLNYLLVFAATAVFVLTLGFWAQCVSAAPLNFATAESVSLASPTTTLTIATSSLADSLEVTTSSILVTLSSSTGGSFTLLSPSYDLSVATSSSGGSVTISCSLNIESAILSQSTGSSIDTVTASGTTCASSAPLQISNISVSGITTNSASISWTTNVLATTTIEYGTTASYGSNINDSNLTTGDTVTLSGLSSNTTYHFAIIAYANGTSTTSGNNTFTTTAASSWRGGSIGVGAGGEYYAPPVSTSSTISLGNVSSTASLEAELASLEAELHILLNEAAARGIVIQGSNASPYVFTRNLFLGSRGPDVASLQHYLNTHGYPVVATPTYPGSLGYETQYFGRETETALIKFQKNAGISPAIGFFGPVTRGYVKSHE